MLDETEAVLQIDTLLAEFEEKAADARHDDLSDLDAYIRAGLCTRMQALIERLSVPGSTYYVAADAVRDAPPHIRLPELRGIVSALKADIQAGWLQDITALLHANTFADFVGMATELLGKGYKDPAAVVAGAVLESHLRLMCEKAGLETESAPGRPKRADALNVELAKAGVYNQLVQKQVLADLAIRNASAHGEFTEYEKQHVRMMIDRVADFVGRFPA